MGRIRTIKPEFPKSETIGSLSRDARLLFVQLWTEADDAGRLRGASRLLASLLYPYDEDAPALIEGWLSELADKGCIRRYVVKGNQYVEIVNWLEHQKIDRPTPSRLPTFDEGSTLPREDSRVLDDGPRTVDLGPRTVDRIRAVPVGTRPPEGQTFEDFWSAYPKRKGSNPKNPAERKFAAAVKSGVDPGEIVASARRYADACRSDGSFGSGYVAQALTWLNQQRWQDYPATNGAAAEEVPRETLERGWRACLQAEREGRGWPSTQIKRTDIPEDFVRQFDLENIQFQPEGMQQ